VAPWYSHVEKFVGVCGNNDGIEAMPDGEFLPPFGFNCVEQHVSDKIKEHYPDRHLVQGRWAQLTQPQEIHLEHGRGLCQARNMCMRGCPYGGYFSSVSSTLPWAEKTGNLTIRPFSVVHSIIYDESTGKASGMKVIDANTKEEIIFKSKLNSIVGIMSDTTRLARIFSKTHFSLSKSFGSYTFSMTRTSLYFLSKTSAGVLFNLCSSLRRSL
jgi:choline dehydrogenase-like flavoprotein